MRTQHAGGGAIAPGDFSERRRIRNWIACLTAVAFAGLTPGCGEQSASKESRRGRSAEPGGDVVLYYSADDPVARPVIDAFERQTGLRVLASGDTEATKNTGLAQRIRTERDRPRADVFWSSEAFMTIRLGDEGLLAPHVTPTTKSWPARLADPQHRWHGFAQRARVVVYNTDRVRPEEAPRTMTDLLNPRWNGRLVMARPSMGTTRGHMGLLVALWGEGNTRAWLEGMRQNQIRLVDGNATVVRAVATGEADVGLTDTDDVWAGRRNGWPVELTYVRHDLPGALVAGPMIIPNTVSMIAGGPNAAGGARLADFLLSAEVERILAASDSHNIPIRSHLASEFSRYAVPDPLEIDLHRVAGAMEEAMRLCDEAFGG